jgi:hypothetical protein
MFREVTFRMLVGGGASNSAQKAVVAVLWSAGMFYVGQVLMSFMLAILFYPYVRLR